jgi:hypothetical protein
LKIHRLQAMEVGEADRLARTKAVASLVAPVVAKAASLVAPEEKKAGRLGTQPGLSTAPAVATKGEKA